MRHIKEYEEHAKTQQELDSDFIGAMFEDGDVKRAKRLILLGANVDARSPNGDTALHFAAEFSPRMVEFLCDNGADTEALDAEGRTPLQHAKIWPLCAKILIERGADYTSAFEGVDELIDFFEQTPDLLKGDISWLPEDAQQRLKKRQRSRGAFGRF
jgi:ankyrin repeat protein